MKFVRVAWVLLAGLALFGAYRHAVAPISTVSLACRKGPGRYHDPLTCDDSVFRLIGIWPSVYPYLILATPALVAGVVLRRWVSFTVLGAYAVLSTVGLMNWADQIWGALLAGVWMGALATLVAVGHWLTRLAVDSRAATSSRIVDPTATMAP